jgi:hypothetical protein
MDKMVTISIRLSRDMAEALRRQARFEGITLDALVRSCLDRNVRRSKACSAEDSNPSFPPETERGAPVDSTQNGSRIYNAAGSQPS